MCHHLFIQVSSTGDWSVNSDIQRNARTHSSQSVCTEQWGNMTSTSVVIGLLLVSCATQLTHQQQCDQPLINNVADFVMHQLLSQYPDVIKLANLTSSFLRDSANVEAKYGSLARISSIRRSGDLVLNVFNNSVNIILEIKFLYLSVTYEEYKLSFAGISTSGSLQTTVMENLIRIDATMGEKSLCFLTINQIKFLKLDDFEVRLKSDCKICSKITSSVMSSALNHFKSRIRSLVEAKLNETLYKILKPDNSVICNKLNMFFSDD